MTFRIHKSSDDHSTTLQLSGRLVGSHCCALSEEVENSRGMIVLDLEEVMLVDLDVVQFLARCEARGMELLHCSPYIREWISRENDRSAKVADELGAPKHLSVESATTGKQAVTVILSGVRLGGKNGEEESRDKSSRS